MAQNSRIQDMDTLGQLKRDTMWLVKTYGYDTVVAWLTDPKELKKKNCRVRLNKGRLWFYAHGNWKKVAPTIEDAITIRAVRTLKESEKKLTTQESKDLQAAIRLSQQALARLARVEESLAKRGKKR